MIYSVLSDRLGNILFEIAAGISLARRLNVPFKAFVGQEDYRYVEYVLQYKKSILRKIDFAESLPQNQKVYNEPFFHYRALPDEKDLTVYGYFQSEKYIDKDFIRELFAIDEETKLYIRHKYQDILNKKPVSVHVRRGDYIQSKLYYAVCPVRYYKKAMRLFSPTTDYLIFSDDIDWCKKHFKGKHFYFSENESPSVDLYLQSFCRHHIISNSTFAWWGAWLDSSPDKRVICPESWFEILYRANDIKDLYPEEWSKLRIRKTIFEWIDLYMYAISHYRYVYYKKIKKLMAKLFI